MDFLKELFDGVEGGALTYEQFAKAAKERELKLANLATGEYVSKKKYEDEVKSKDTMIADLNATIDTRNTDLKALQEKLDKAGTDSTQIESLSGELEKLRKDYDKATKDYNSKLQKQAYEFAVSEYANSLSFTSEAAKRDFKRSMLEKQLPMENGNILGRDDYRAEYEKGNSDAFAVAKEETKASDLPKFASNTTDPNNAGTDGHKKSLSELMKAKNDNPSMTINFG